MATAEQLDSRCTVDFVGVALMNDNPAMYAAVMQRIIRHLHTSARIDVYAAERQPNGWLEWQLHIYHAANSRPLVLGAIQRKPGGEVEFHS